MGQNSSADWDELACIINGQLFRLQKCCILRTLTETDKLLSLVVIVRSMKLKFLCAYRTLESISSTTNDFFSFFIRKAKDFSHSYVCHLADLCIFLVHLAFFVLKRIQNARIICVNGEDEMLIQKRQTEPSFMNSTAQAYLGELQRFNHPQTNAFI